VRWVLKMLKPHNVAEVKFETVKEIGQEGRNSTAHIVQDLQLDAQIVMKRIEKKSIASPDEYFQEARTLYASSHQNVVPVIYACEDAEHVFIALPYFENGSLKALMKGRNLTVREIVRISCQLLSGIHNIHSKGLIHFDIKPDNVLLSARGEALLSDFGLAKQMHLGQAEQSRLYLPITAPEVVNGGGPYDLRFDIYQFGLVLYRMCCGENSLRDQLGQLDPNNFLPHLAQALRDGTYPDKSSFPEHIPDRLRKIIVKCLSTDPDDRYGSALEVANALADVEDCLDWTYVVEAGGRSWVRQEGEMEKRFRIAGDGSTEFTATKNGTTRRKTAHCKASMTTAGIRRVLKSEG